MTSEPINTNTNTYTAFAGERRIGTGTIDTVALMAKPLLDVEPNASVLFFDDDSGREVDLNLRGSQAEVLARLAEQFPKPLAAHAAQDHQPDQQEQEQEKGPEPQRGRGRPKLGVVAREVTLLPRHWDWLNSRPGSASVVLRKLVDEARRAHAQRDEQQRAQNATFNFISAMAGDRPSFEEASRALFAGARRRFFECIDAWPTDIRRHAERMSANAFDGESNER